jgi:hypothetical protein
MIKVPDKCLICKSKWIGGHQKPGKAMTLNLRVFYECGASMSIMEVYDGCYLILFKNCGKDVK